MYIKSNFLFLFLTFFIVEKSSAQKQFTFNSEGNSCFIEYVVYAQNQDYGSIKRPFIFVIGEDGETAQEAFEHDSMKDRLQFYNYKFIYIPNRGGSASNKLNCVEALSSLVTFQYAFGNANLFLQINDWSITQADIQALRLNSVFKNVRLSDLIDPSQSLSKTSAAEDFQENVNEYIVQAKNDNDKYGTFYIEEENTDQEKIPKSQKTYFGPPQTFDYNLSGIVRDGSTGEALPFASIKIKSNGKGASSNADGYFTLLKVPSDTSTLVVSYVGYEKIEVFLTPMSNKKNFLIELLPTTNELAEVKVVAARGDVILSKKEEVSVIKMTPKQLEKLPNLGEKDVMRSFQLMPGVSASNESSSGLYVRGGTPDQNLVLYDGFTVYQVDHLYGFFSAFNSNALKDVQLYKGGFESRFGGRLSSVTELTGKDGNQKKINFGGDLSLLSTNLFMEIPIGEKFSSIIAFRRSYKGFIYNEIFDKFNKSSNSTETSSTPSGMPGGPGGRAVQNTKVSSYFYDLNGKFTYKPSNKDIISFSIFNGTDKLDNSSSSESPSFGLSNSNFSMSSTDLTKYGNVGSSLKWSRKWNDKFYGNTILSYSNYYSNRDKSQTRTSTNANGDETSTQNGILEKNDLRDYSFKTDYQWDIFSFSKLQFGAFATYYDIKYTYAQNDTSTILDKQNEATLSGGYLQNKMTFLNNKIHLLPGIRASYFQTTDKMYYEPRISLSANVTKRFTIKAATGKYYQFANRITREDILSGSKDFWLLSDDESVPVSSSVHYIAGLSYETNSYLFSAEGYYKELENLTEYSLRFNSSPMGVSYNENFFSGSGFSRGVEFLAQKKSGKFNGWVSYTLGEARSKFEVYSDTYFPANQDVTHEFKMVMLYKYKRWDFSATWIYATGRPYTAPSGAYSVTLLDGTTQEYFTVTTKNGLRLSDYHRCDISASYKLLSGEKGMKKRREIGSISFSIFNLYNRTNIWYKQYTIEDGSILETNVNYLGLVPNITLSLKLR